MEKAGRGCSQHSGVHEGYPVEMPWAFSLSSTVTPDRLRGTVVLIVELKFLLSSSRRIRLHHRGIRKRERSNLSGGKAHLRFVRQQLFISSLLLPEDSFLVQKGYNLLKPAKGSYRFLKGTLQSLLLASEVAYPLLTPWTDASTTQKTVYC